MKKITMAVLAAGCSLVLAAAGMAQTGGTDARTGQQPARSEQAGQQMRQQDSYARQIMEPGGLTNLTVVDAQGEEIGTVDQVVLDAREGRIGFIVVTTGGVLGVGGERSIVPWGAVQYQERPAQQGEDGEPVLMVNVPQERLMAAPHGEAHDIDRRYAELIHEYYGVAPYWEEASPEAQQPEQQPMEQQPMPGMQQQQTPQAPAQ